MYPSEIFLGFIKYLENIFENKYIIDHLDGNIFDYRPENLEWVTPSENNRRREKYTHRKKI